LFRTRNRPVHHKAVATEIADVVNKMRKITRSTESSQRFVTCVLPQTNYTDCPIILLFNMVVTGRHLLALSDEVAQEEYNLLTILSICLTSTLLCPGRYDIISLSIAHHSQSTV
jgi:hypothetical protein